MDMCVCVCVCLCGYWTVSLPENIVHIYVTFSMSISEFLNDVFNQR